MSDSSQVVAARLAEHALEGPQFDLASITADHDQRIEMDRSLDALIGSGDTDPPAPFDPRDPR
jgi:hypothetical protein